ncbi:MAG: hypothetical protein COV55_02385 [Candidatus Komeilibacteria bacterium CG11_big_fil_rev_8_21_14_0_20_36_20]|uniref:Uncharacterized protein n=1 Tax=Candidatus Komeilibacteria bacterium CG11_big_fil_rev_8_21_14_0_20_36_20 TaxID=1974477 RepID=A0A2H0NF44_9BACT|nr:MAG: hypothetical protein COV55_02385 [Candidatus Komeilibacteria bacterium CG11_big_fil_rev_8_21_14_0_20_36_20]PIR81821.1 MAG: hypothetical protein COU21_01445 [Candidatus Komeilibacteria bacterium CG10_big_fil_rev_8_21_14_0_10_36_65]PJC55311.1 MAG: hypothetical protein CO027_02780 [Candidatus Komeilibacteria bacterium CG_4_9_14_0_2_um_filter_36_13]
MAHEILDNNQELINQARKVVKENYKPELEDPKGSQGEIFNLQVEKQKIMQALHSDLEKIEQGSDLLEGQGEINRDVIYDKNKKIFYIDNNQKLEVATFGDLITDVSHGIEYNLNTGDIPRAILKKYATERAKSHIRKLFDIQLLIQAEAQHKKLGHSRKSEILSQVKEKHKTGIDNFENRAGLIFERDIINMLKQLQVDLPNLGIEIEDVNVIQDMDQKVDFIIKVKQHHRAVQVEESEESLQDGHNKVFGIQFTLNPEATQHKMKQIEESIRRGVKQEIHIDDLLLITIPVSSNEIVRNYQNWQQLGKPTGGPERFYDINTKIEILGQLLEGIKANNIIDANKKNIARYYDSKLELVDTGNLVHLRPDTK